MTPFMKPCVFIDRDGTINKCPDKYFYEFEKLELYNGVIEGIKLLNKDFTVICITNQGGIAKEIYSCDDVIKVNLEIKKRLIERDALIDEFYFCPHHPDAIYKSGKNCECRKPKTGLFYKAMHKYNIDLKNSFFIGDSFTDLLSAVNLKIKFALVLQGHYSETIKKTSETIRHGISNYKEIRKHYWGMFNSVYEASKAISKTL